MTLPGSYAENIRYISNTYLAARFMATSLIFKLLFVFCSGHRLFERRHVLVFQTDQVCQCRRYPIWAKGLGKQQR